jgi:hypothetical protein
LLRFQLREVQQRSEQQQASLNQRAMLVFTDIVNALGYAALAAESGDPNARNALKAWFENFDRARKVAESKIIVPPGSHSRYAAHSHDGEETLDADELARQQEVAGG